MVAIGGDRTKCLSLLKYSNKQHVGPNRVTRLVGVKQTYIVDRKLTMLGCLGVYKVMVDNFTENVHVLLLSASKGVPEHKRPQVGPVINSRAHFRQKQA